MPQELTIVKAEPLTVTASTPSGSERTRQDTNVIGIDHDKIVQGIANWASKLPPQWQKPAAMIATLPADALASLVEMFSAPETIATMGARPAMAAMDKAGDVVGTAADAVTGALAKPVRIAKAMATDPDVVGIMSPRVGNTLRVAQRAASGVLKARAAVQAEDAAKTTAQTIGQSLPPPSELSPIELTRSLKGGGVPSPTVVSISPQMIRNQLGMAARRAGVSLTDDVETAATALMKQGSSAADALTQALSAGKTMLTAGEAKLVDAMSRRGASDEEIQAAIKAARAFNAKFGLAAPSRKDILFPKGMRGAPSGAGGMIP